MQAEKDRLDSFINKQRIAMYKPIQVAEILHRVRLQQDGMSLDKLSDVEHYRNASKRWRDAVTRLLIGQVSTSSQRFQDNLFESNAIPPPFLKQLAEINNRFNGVVERYIYQRFALRQKAIFRIMKYVHEAGAQGFGIERFLSMFEEHGLRRSIDKAYEIVVYALFRALLQAVGARVTISIDPAKMDVLKEFEDFTRLVLGIDSQTLSREVTAQISRTGVANAADRGLDMWANFGPAVQVKHVSLSEEFAEEVAEEVKADEIIIVCRSAERKMVERICRQLGQRLRGIITESELISWYERALSSQRQDGLGARLIENLKTELSVEFPFSASFQTFYEERGYDKIPKPAVDCPFWEEDTWKVE